MGESVKRVLFVNSEMFPYLPESDIANIGRYLPQGIQERKKEIRSFMPRYGCINERKNQLHEVIRLSGMNIVISDVDRPLVIKVASISAARMQVYFIDNEDYFHRKSIYKDENGNSYSSMDPQKQVDGAFSNDNPHLEGYKPEDAIKEIGMVSEGMYTAEVVKELSESTGVDMPIFNAIYDVINGNITVQDAMEDLMCRPVGREADYL